AGGSGARTTTATARNGGNGGRGRVWIYWSDFPTVTSINRADSTTAYAYNYVRWTVVFSKPVTGVDKTDFSLTPGYSAYHTGFEITDVSSSDGGTTWTVTAYTGWITGSVSSSYLSLNLNDDDSIREVGTGMYLSGNANRGSSGKSSATQSFSQVAYRYTVNAVKPTLKKTAVTTSVLQGEIGVFNLSVTGAASVELKNLVVTDTLPNGLVYVSHLPPSIGTISVSGQTITWRIPYLAAKATANVRISVRVNAAETNTMKLPGAADSSASILMKKDVHAHFRMDETADSWNGTESEVLDSGGEKLHGKRVGDANAKVPSPTIDSQNAAVINSFCNAGNFGGSGYVVVPRNLGSKLDYGAEMSATAWIYVKSRPASGGLRSILSNDENYELHIDSNGRLYWWWNPGTGALSQTSSVVIPNNTWTHVAITFSSAGRQRIYINGTLDTGATGTKNSTVQLNRNNACPFLIGSDVNSGTCAILPERNFVGLIDEVRLYEQELSAEEIESDMIYGRQCADVFDHIRIEHSGQGKTCVPETVTVKACMDAACSTLFGGTVTAHMTPAGWVGGNTFSFSNGTATRQLNVTTAGDATLGVINVAPGMANPARCFTANGETCTMNFTSCNSAFDAVEPGGAPRTNLFTKLAGVPFTFDLLAMETSTTVNQSYSGTVNIDLVDAQTVDCQENGTGLSTVQIVVYDNEPGRKNVQFSHPSAERKVRVRIRESGGTQTYCSTDTFAIRPRTLAVSSSANADALGTNASATPTVKAGVAFTLLANSGTVGYNGLPKVNPSLIEWLNAPAGGRAAPGVGEFEGSAGSLPLPFTTAAQPGTGNGASGNFAYNEVGYFRFKADGVYDDTFVAPSDDIIKGDCIVSSASNTLASGKYGCNVGSTESAYFGRFIPSHFDTSVEQGCADGNFTYSGQPFSVTVTAKNEMNGTTQNYTGAFARNVTLTVRDAADTQSNPGPGTLLPSVVSNTDFSGGIGSFSPKYDFSVANTPPTGIRLRASDGEISSLVVLPLSPDEGRATIRSGRASLASAYGSEQLDMPVTFRVEYYDGSGWQKNAQDTCTGNTALHADNKVSLTLTRSPASLGSCVLDSGNPGNSGLGCAAVSPTAKRFIKGATPGLGFAGDFNLWLQAPGANQFGTIKINATMPPWLGDVSATTVFGRYKSPVIYRRENY
ncbi:MAG: DUF11 domain-containing protein, partial [Azoarcus sp.]|nr:DUF11 domain-containing protein [Azoarcus sp.]